jgi:hypothetical protein
MVNLSPQGHLTVESTEKLSTDEIQPLLDSSRLNQRAYYASQKEIDKQHQIYTLMIVALLSLGLFTVSFAFVRTVSQVFKQSTIEVNNYVG